jgi:hypothetical protein
MIGNKFGNKRTEYKGEVYDSKKEAEYAKQLDFQKRAVNIKDRVISWERQIPFLCVVNGKKVCKYIADFKVKYADDREEIIDVKGMRTPMYNLKKKLVEALYPIEIREV